MSTNAELGEQNAGKRRLKSWKEIAAFLGCDQRTAKRWEVSRSLPVRRLGTGPRSGVFAFTNEIEAWLRGETPPLLEKGSDSQDEEPSSGASWIGKQRPRSFAWFYRGGIVLGVLFLATAIAAVAVMNSSGPVRSGTRHTPDAQAQAFYRAGFDDWQQRTPASLTRAVDEFTQAIVHDPQNAAAYSGLANCYNLLREYTTMPAGYAFPRAKAAAERAIALDPTLADAHAALAFTDFYWSYDAATSRREFERAIQLAPDNATAHHWYAGVLTMQGAFPKALFEIEKAQKLEPGSLSILADKGLILFHAGRTHEATVLLRQLEQTAPKFASAHLYLAAIDDATDDNDDFLRELSSAADAREDAQYRALIAAGTDGLNSGGRPGMFRAMLKVRERLFVTGKGDAYPVALLYADLGNKVQALRYLKLSLARRETEAVALGVDFDFDNMRDQTDFRAIVRELGFENFTAP